MLSAATTIVTLIVATVAGTFLQRHRFPGRTVLIAMLTFPLAFPGVVVGFLIILLAVSWPPMVERYRRLQQPQTSADPAVAPVARPRPARPIRAPLPPVWPAPDMLTTEELCVAWRASYPALQRAQTAADRIGLVQVRAGYLDALQQRDPGSFARWLDSGARAAGDPGRYLASPRPGTAAAESQPTESARADHQDVDSPPHLTD